MAHLISGYIGVAKLEEILQTVKGKGEKGFRFTASVNDTTDDYGNNVSFFAEQTKEQREAQHKKYYFASGKVFWKNGDSVHVALKVEKDLDKLLPGKKEDLPF